MTAARRVPCVLLSGPFRHAAPDSGGSTLKGLFTRSRRHGFAPYRVIGLDQATCERQAEMSTPRAARISAWKGLDRVTT
jgi:hypothetical protein